jgi:hypothetical protein
MQIDQVYKTVQALLNKDSLGNLKPLWFNLFAQNAQRKEYNKYFNDLKSNVRRQNWMLDGKDFANLAQHSQQLLEHFSKELIIESETTSVGTPFSSHNIPIDLEFIEDVFIAEPNTKSFLPTRVQKVDYSDFRDLQRNIYAKPTECTPVCSKFGTVIRVAPQAKAISLHYLRKPKTPKWTFNDFQGVAMFNPTAQDFQDFDLPETSYDSLVSYIAEQAAIALRDGMVIQAANAEQQEDFVIENRE